MFIMQFTFGIITCAETNGKLPDRVETIMNSIRHACPPTSYEIIIVGGHETFNFADGRVISFDENQKKMWITRKKNIITEESQYENIVYMHDYIVLDSEW